MELYLRWLSKHERREGEQEPLGIILCAGKKQELVELLDANTFFEDYPHFDLTPGILNNSLENHCHFNYIFNAKALGNHFFRAVTIF